MECSICCELYNRSFRKPIHCIYCESSVCISCIKQYLLDTIHQPHCMNCRKEWSHSFLMKHLSGFITTDYRKKRELLLFEKAKSKIPDLLPEIEKEKQYRLCTKYIIQTQQELSDWYHKRRYMCIEDWRLEKKSIKETIQQLHIDRILIYETRTERKTFIMKCTIGDCRGYLSNKYKCGLCHGDVCPHCHIELQYEHKCNPDIVANIQELKKNTKPCPKCHIPIYKTEGCDQMWCTSCHMTFDWKSGHIVRGIIHNPHYHEYIEQHGTVPLQQRSYRFVFIPPEVIEKILHELTNELLVFQLLEVYRYTTIYFYDDLQKLPSRFDERINLDLRIQYLMNQLTEEEFKTKLQRRQKDIDKKIEYRDIGETYIDIIHDLFISFLTMKDIDILIHEIKTIIQDTNKAIIHLNKRYHSNLQLIRTDFI